jgi:hypothetical protein
MRRASETILAMNVTRVPRKAIRRPICSGKNRKRRGLVQQLPKQHCIPSCNTHRHVSENGGDGELPREKPVGKDER